MKKLFAVLVLRLAVLVLVSATAFAACTGSSPTWTTTNDLASVQACINGATSGDTINVTAGTGTATWASALAVTRSVHLIGPGAASLTVSGMVQAVLTGAEATKVFELSGFTFTNIGGDCFEIFADATNPATSLTIHANTFTGCNHGVSDGGTGFGVFYSNTFTNNNIDVVVGGCGVGTYAAGTCEALVPAFGSANYPFFEDNTFGNGTGSFVTESGQGGRMVFRHNTITGYACSGCEVFDAHGDQGTGGTVSTEIYHNSIDVGASGTYRWMGHRGGQAIIANNTVSRLVAFTITEYRSWGGNGVCQAYPATGQINDTAHGIGAGFYFGNIVGGSPETPQYVNTTGGTCGSDPPWGDNNFIVQNRDFWLPTYGLEAALPATCTADGNTFYGTTDTDKIFKCKALNTWSAAVADGGFTPYTYPHPLRTTGTPVPVATLTTSLAVVSPNATFTLTWGCTNTPTSANIDAIGAVSPASGGTTSAITVVPGTTTYTLTCTNAAGAAATTVNVTQGGSIQGANTIRTANTVVQ